jgi:hypothetical protein
MPRGYKSHKHKWKYYQRTGLLGFETQYRKCQLCGLKQYQQTDLFTGRKRWES